MWAVKTQPRAGTPTTTAASAVSSAPVAAASVPQAPPGIPQQCVAIEGLLTNATAVIGTGGEVNTASHLKARFDAYGKQLTAVAAGGPAKVTTSVMMFIAALDTYANDAQTGTPPPPNLLSDAAGALTASCAATG